MIFLKKLKDSGLAENFKSQNLRLAWASAWERWENKCGFRLEIKGFWPRVKFPFAESPPSVGLSMVKEMYGFPKEIKGLWPRVKLPFAESPPSMGLSMGKKMYGFLWEAQGFFPR